VAAVAVPPGASFTATPNPAQTGQEVKFNASGSTGTAPLTYEWEFDGDGLFDDATGVTATRVYASSGSKLVRLRVTNAEGPNSISQQNVQVNSPPNKPPVALFRYFPASPTAGTTVDLVSTSYDPDGPLASLTWDLDNDGQFDDAAGAEASRSFTAGVRTVSLLARDGRGASAVLSRRIVVAPNLVNPTLLSPFPVIRLVGRITSRGARVRRLTVAAPAGSSVVIRCNGPSCPRRRLTTVARTGKTIRFKTFERRLRAGVILRIFVSRPNSIGKHTRFGIRRRRSPSRRDRCLMPGSTKPTACPAS
jgi:hypothetical protein